jgi:hypothetical protein
MAALVRFQMNAIAALRQRRVPAIDQVHFLDAARPCVFLLEFDCLLVGFRI